MTLTELISELQALLDKEGDIPVYVVDNDEVQGKPIMAVCNEGARRWVLL